ncbi:hypothetical protein OJF2_16110 [Aquisphaera giovannonii]|uniref:Tellurite resistance protein TerB n=1 Tax=Aquisphaera giovannonii TaxID=406548 RepID=A0A5B9VYQ7_9BACT|nr:hypothetical protein [Aquisphaera giovannonii]QEH33114.1 hypothetical protein OJF2_16110 [Aquisphaera giovannonii]
MGFFNALKRVLTHEGRKEADDDATRRIRDLWGLDEEEPGASPSATVGADASAYDRSQWQKRLQRIVDELPESRPRWADLMQDAHALHLEPAWLHERHLEALALLVRRAVADRVFSEQEHRRIDLARDLMNIPEEEAVKVLHDIVAEAEAVFGAPIKDEG